MKKLLLSVSALALLSAPAFADDYAYIGVGVGYGQTEEIDVSGGPAQAQLDADEEVWGNITLGRRLESGWRWELEVPYRQNEFEDSVSGGEGEVRNYGLLVNLAYDFNPNGVIQPYLGAGVGYGITDIDFSGSVGGVAFDVDDDSDGVIAQGMAGVAFRLSDSWVADLGYRYFWADASDEFSGLNIEDDYRRHDGIVSLRYAFGGTGRDTTPIRQDTYTPPPPPAPLPPEPLPVPPPPPPPPPPVATCPGAEATIYFDFDSTAVDAQSTGILQQLVSVQRSECLSEYVVVGYTDTQGSPTYNQRLSQRRADAVRRALINLGVQTALIRTEALGQNNPAVQTGDGVREEQNRRVVVTLRTTPRAGETGTAPSGGYGSSSGTGSTGPYSTAPGSSTYMGTTSSGSSTYPGTSTSPGSSTYPGTTTSPGSSTYPGTTTSPGSSTYPGTSTLPGSSTYPGTSTSPGTSTYRGTTTSPGTSTSPVSPTSPQ
jgi:outer membrane protein OmpA-like peptidoglycan-associated protein/opacity protein-like surface antigen